MRKKPNSWHVHAALYHLKNEAQKQVNETMFWLRTTYISGKQIFLKEHNKALKICDSGYLFW